MADIDDLSKQGTSKHGPSIQWIKGSHDIGSAIAHTLRKAGLRPVLVDVPRPLITRRRMCFGPVLHGEPAQLAGLTGVRCETWAQVLSCFEDANCVPVWENADFQPPPQANVAIVVDARMRKKEVPPIQIREAPLVLGTGPGFVAGDQVHGVIESYWGDQLGAVVWEGGALAYTGHHREVAGHSAERYLYAPRAGVFHAHCDILQPVEVGQVVGRVEDSELMVGIRGVLKGLAYDGISVPAGVKLAEVEPRGEAAACMGISERPARIAQGVLRAIREKMPHLFKG